MTSTQTELPTGTHWSVDNSWAEIRNVSAADEAELYSLLRVRPKNYFFDFRFRAGVWDGWHYFYDRTRHRIATGLLPMVRQMGFEWPEHWAVAPPHVEFQPPDLAGITFAPKQLAAIDSVRRGHQRGVFDYITGYGKTVTFIAITKMLNLRTMIVEPGVELLEQVAEQVQTRVGLGVGRVGSGHNERGRQVTVVTDDMLKRLPRWELDALAADVQVLHMDEVHNCTDRLHPFFRACTNAYYRYGWSGTPFDLGKERAVSVMGLFGPILHSATAADLVAAQRGVPAEFVFVDVPVPRVFASDYAGLYSAAITHNTAFHAQVGELVQVHHDGDTSILILVRRIEHGRALLTELQRLKIPAEFVSGKHNPHARERTKAAFHDGKLKVLIASDIYKEGVDLPCIEVLLLAGGGESNKDWRQRVGRGLRTHPGKASVRIYDFLFTGNKILEKHSQARLKRALELEGSKVSRLDSFLGELVPVSAGKAGAAA